MHQKSVKTWMQVFSSQIIQILDKYHQEKKDNLIESSKNALNSTMPYSNLRSKNPKFMNNRSPSLKDCDVTRPIKKPTGKF